MEALPTGTLLFYFIYLLFLLLYIYIFIYFIYHESVDNPELLSALLLPADGATSLLCPPYVPPLSLSLQSWRR